MLSDKSSYLPMLAINLLVTLAVISLIEFIAPSNVQIFNYLLIHHDVPGGLVLLAVLLAAASLSRRHIDTDRFALWVGRNSRLIAVLLWIVLSLGSMELYQSHPLSMDEYAASFQAAIFANGSLTVHLPTELVDRVIPKEFQGHFLTVNGTTGETASAYWPGFALILAPFVWLGVPWACNPLIAALSLLLIGKIAVDIFGDERVGGWAVMFALASPAFTLNGISFYSMPAHLLFNLLFASLLLAPTPLRIILAGLVGSYALILHNPFPHLLFALPWLGWLVFRRQGGVRNALLLLTGYLSLALIGGFGWAYCLEDIRRAGMPMPNPVATENNLPWILRTLQGAVSVFGIPDVMTLWYRIAELSKLWLWSSPFMLVLAWMAANRMQKQEVRLLGASILFTFLGYFLVPVSQGHGWGARYLHSAWGVLPILAAGWICQPSRAGERNTVNNSMLMWGVLLSLVAVVGLRAWQIGDFMEKHLAQIPRYPKDRPSIIFVRHGYYAADLVQNDPWLLTQPWIFVSQGVEKDLELAKCFLPGGETYFTNTNGWTYAATTGETASPSNCKG